MAFLFLRSNGVYYIIERTRTKSKWWSLKTRDKVEAESLYQTYKEQFDRRKKYPISTFRDDFLAVAGLNLSPGTIRMYQHAFAEFIRLCGDKPLKYIVPLDIDKFKVLRSKEVNPVTINISLRCLRAAFNEAIRLKLIHDNPLKGIKMVRVPYKDAAYLNENDLKRLLNVIDDPGIKNMVLFAVYTMMRRSEIMHLEWSDVDMEKRMIYVRNKSDFRVKCDKPRTIPMHEWVYQLLIGANRKSSYVFTNSQGRHFRGEEVSKKFKAYVRSVDINPQIHFHSLRHTGISMLLQRGVQPTYIQRIAGHSSFLTTNLYLHTDREQLLSAINHLQCLN